MFGWFFWFPGGSVVAPSGTGPTFFVADPVDAGAFAFVERVTPAATPADDTAFAFVEPA